MFEAQNKSKREAAKKPSATAARSAEPALTNTGERISFQLFTQPLTADTPSEREADEAAGAALQDQSGGAGATPSTPPGAPPSPPSVPIAPFGVIIEDGSALSSGQMHRTQFIEVISAEIERAADEELAATGHTSRDCPYLSHWLRFYRERSAAHIERAIQHYARPERTDLANLREAVVARVRGAIQSWVRSGGREIQTPEGLAWLGHNDGLSQSSGAVEPIQRYAIDDDGSAPSTSDPFAIRAQLRNGRPLEGGVRARMEQGFGRSLGNVRLHTDGNATQMAGAYSARAFTIGDDIAFGAGQYRPGTLAGDALLAHELAHTMLVGEQSGDAGAERAANAVAARVVTGLWTGQASEGMESFSPTKSNRELSLRRCGDGEKPELTVRGPDETRKLGYRIEAPLGETTVGRTYELRLRGRQIIGPYGTSDAYSGRWFVQRPGESEPHGLTGWTGWSRAWTLDAAGPWVFFVEIPLGGNEFGVLTHSINVREQAPVVEERLDQVPTTNLAGFLTRLEYQNLMNIRLGIQDQNLGGAYISLEGDNPARTYGNWPDNPSNVYTVHPPPGGTPASYQWMAMPEDLQDYPTVYFDHRRRQIGGRDGFDLGTNTSANWTLADRTGIIQIYCTMYDAQGGMMAEARYRQVILNREERRRTTEFQTYMREAREELRKLRQEAAVFVPAIHLATETGVTTELSLFLGPPATGSGLKIIDVTPGVAVREYDGVDFAAALNDFNTDNSYPPGRIRLRIPANNLGIPANDWTVQTTGASVAQQLSTGWGWASLGLAGLGALALVIPGAQPLAPSFFLASAGLGAASAGASLYQRSQEAHPSGIGIAIDIASLAGSLLGLAGAANILRHGPRIAALTRTGRFVLYAGFVTEALGGVFILAEGAERISAILDGPGNAETKAAAVTRILAGLLLNGSLLAWGARDLGAARRQVGQVLGEVMTSQLTAHELHLLSVLEGPGMSRLAGASLEEVRGIAALISEDPIRAARLVEGYGERFVMGARAGPQNLEELAQALHAGAPEGGGTRGQYGPRTSGTPRPAYVEKGGDSSPGNLADRIRRNFTNLSSPSRRQLAEGATLRNAPTSGTAPAGGVQTRYELVITGSGSRPEIVIPVRIESTATRPTSVHGAETGPARMEIRSSVDSAGTTRYEASIEVHRDLAGSDVRNAVGHELDELAHIAVAGVRGPDITAQKRASLLRTQAATPGATTPPITAHDHAAAREFADFVRQNAPIGGRPPNYAIPDDVVSRAISMGFGGTAFLEEKLALLRTAGVDDDMLGRLRVTALRAEAALSLPVASPVATTRVIGHLLNRSGGTPASPVGGLHLDSALVAHQAELVRRNDPIHLVLTADSPRTRGGVTYNAYEQWRWTGGGAPGARPTSPGGAAGATHGGWALVAEPKTSFDNLSAFLLEAQSAWDAWRAANTMPNSGTNHFWSMSAGSGRQEIAGYFNITGSGVEFISVFPYRAGGIVSW